MNRGSQRFLPEPWWPGLIRCKVFRADQTEQQLHGMSNNCSESPCSTTLLVLGNMGTLGAEYPRKKKLDDGLRPRSLDQLPVLRFVRSHGRNEN